MWGMCGAFEHLVLMSRHPIYLHDLRLQVQQSVRGLERKDEYRMRYRIRDASTRYLSLGAGNAEAPKYNRIPHTLAELAVRRSKMLVHWLTRGTSGTDPCLALLVVAELRDTEAIAAHVA
jgi:hypothetical protein